MMDLGMNDDCDIGDCYIYDLSQFAKISNKISKKERI